MSSSTTTETLLPSSYPSVTPPPTYGKIHYIPANHTPTPSPHNFHLPPMSDFKDSRILPLHDLRPLPTLNQLPKAKARLSSHNFTTLTHPSALHSAPYAYTSWKDPNLLTQIYIPETEALVRHITGAHKVITESLLLRSVLWTEEDALATHAGHSTNSQEKGNRRAAGELQPEPEHQASTAFPQLIGFDPSTGGASPAPKVHQDYTPAGARTHIRNYHPALRAAAAGIIAAEDARLARGLPPHGTGPSDSPPRRWALYSIWRPLKRVRRDPLALGDARTFGAEDYVPVVVRTPTLGGRKRAEVHECEAWLARSAAGHRWCWVSDQMPEEVLVIGLFDSACEGEGLAAGGAMHSSVELEETTGEEARESLELRCLAIW